jgi:GMP synthase-like glutamine amidotransferase
LLPLSLCFLYLWLCPFRVRMRLYPSLCRPLSPHRFFKSFTLEANSIFPRSLSLTYSFFHTLTHSLRHPLLWLIIFLRLALIADGGCTQSELAGAGRCAGGGGSLIHRSSHVQTQNRRQQICCLCLCLCFLQTHFYFPAAQVCPVSLLLKSITIAVLSVRWGLVGARVCSDTVPPALLLEFLKSKGAAIRIVSLEREPLPALTGNECIISLGGHMGAYDDDKYTAAALMHVCNTAAYLCVLFSFSLFVGNRYAFIGAEKELMREAVRRNIPVLGICLGAQLLADGRFGPFTFVAYCKPHSLSPLTALGGKAFPAASFEGGFPEIKVSAFQLLLWVAFASRLLLCFRLFFVQLTAEGLKDPIMKSFKDPVLLHHGDTFTVPSNATLLASTIVCMLSRRFRL